MIDFDTYYYDNKDIHRMYNKEDCHQHYYKHGIKEGRRVYLDIANLSFNQIKNLRYSLIPEDSKQVAPILNNFPCHLKSDISTHLPVLEYYSSKCNHVTEFGVRNGFSTIAILSGIPENGTLISYDIEEYPFVHKISSKISKNWRFVKHSTIDPLLTIEETDLIFFDTVHTYDHLIKELRLHGNKSKKYLIFHDTNIAGVQKAIEEYSEKNYDILYNTKFCNGFLVLGKI